MIENKIELYSDVVNGHISQECRSTIARCLRNLEGKQIKIVVEEKNKRRSQRQNRYLWGVVVPKVKEELQKHVEDSTIEPEDAYFFIKRYALNLIDFCDTPLGRITITTQMRNMNTENFEENMEKIRAFFAERGIEIPLPNEEL